MLLTILIPTRNRPARLRPLVASLLENLPSDRKSAIEIVVLDNCSDEPATEVLRPYACDMLRIITNERLHPTSEENVVNGIVHARGDYIWFLGDDDLPRYPAVDEMIELVAAGVADLFISNFRVLDGQGRLASLGQIRGVPVDLHLPLVSIIKRIGIINVLSGWSIIVARREMLDTNIAREIMTTGVIYSHCFWFLECFADKRTCFLARPLVDFRVFHHADGWHRYTDERNVGYLHYWHLGLIRHYARAMEKGLLTARDIAETFEYRHNGTRYRNIDEILYKLIEQADIYMRTGLTRNLLTRLEFDEATEWLMKIDLGLQDILASVKQIYQTLWSGAQNVAALDAIETCRGNAIELVAARDRDLFSPFFVVFVYGYSVYRYGEWWIAIREDATNLSDAVFAQIVPRSVPPQVLVEDTRLKLEDAIQRTPSWPEPVGERPPSVSMTLLDEVQAVGERGSLMARLGDSLLEAADAKVAKEPVATDEVAPIRHLWIGSAAIRRAEQRAVMRSGWSHPEADGVWSLGTRSVIGIDVPSGYPLLCFEVHAFAPRGNRQVEIVIGGLRRHLVSDGGMSVIRLPLAFGTTHVDVDVLSSPAETPAALGLSSDTRPLGLFVHRIWAESSIVAKRKPRRLRWWRWLRKRL